MKKILAVVVITGLFAVVGFAQQETFTAAQIVDRVGARILQLPDGQIVKNISGSMTFTAKLNETDYSNLKPIAEKLIGKIPSNPVKFEGNFISVLQMPGGKVEKFMFAGKSELGSVYIYRNLDNFVCLLPDMSIQIEDKISEIRKLSSRGSSEFPEKTFMSDLSGFMISNSLKTLFSMGKTWFYDAELSTLEKSGKKLVKLTKTENKRSVEITVDPATSLFTELLFKNGKSTVLMEFCVPEDIKKIALTDYMPKSISLDAVDKENIIKIELGSLVYNSSVSDDIFNLKKMKLSEFISAMAIKLMNP